MNIYNDSNPNTSSDFTNITAQNAIFENAAIDNLNVDQTAIFNTLSTGGLKITGLNSGDILTAGVGGQINGLTVGNNHDVLTSNGTSPVWTNGLTLNSLTTNTLSIPGTSTGDLLSFVGTSANRLPIGSSGTFLISNGTNATWSSLPNPLVVGSLQANNNIQIVGFNGGIITSTSIGFLQNLNYGSNNTVLTSSGSAAVWTNSLVLNSLTTNTLVIPGTSTGDLLSFSGTTASRLPIGAAGTFLISNGTNATWSSLPNPLIIGSLQVNNNIQAANYPNLSLVTDSTGFLTSERSQLSQNGGTGLTTTNSQFYGNATWTMTNNSWYAIKVDLTCTTTTAFFGSLSVNNSTIQFFNYNGGNVETLCLYSIYQYTGSNSTTVPIGLLARTATGTANISGYNIYVERIAAPILHV